MRRNPEASLRRAALSLFGLGASVILTACTSTSRPSNGDEIASSTPTAELSYPAPSLADLRYGVEQLLQAGDLHYKDEYTSEYRGCRLAHVYEGVISASNAYGRREQGFADEEAEASCHELGVITIPYLETYWMGSDILSRQYANHNFERIPPESRLTLAPNPSGYLAERLAPSIVRLVGAGLIDGERVIKTASEGGEWKGTIAFFLGPDDVISGFSYSLAKNASERRDGVLRLLPPIEVSYPGLGDGDDPDFLRSALRDMQTHEDVNYDVYSGQFLITFEKEFVPSILASFYGEEIPATVTCYVELPECQGKLPEFFAIFDRLEALLGDAGMDYCAYVASEGQREATKLSDTYKGLISVNVSNQDRNPGNSFDFSLKVTFDVEGEDFGRYEGVLTYGREYCFEGVAGHGPLLDFRRALEDYAKSLR